MIQQTKSSIPLSNRTWKTLFLHHGDIFRLFLCTAFLFIVMGALNPEKFLTARNFISMSFQFPELGLFSLAVMVSIITGGIDLSVVSIANLSGILAAMILSSSMPPSISIVAAISTVVAVSSLCGLFNGFLIAYAGITPILATLGTMQLFAGLSFVLTKGTAVSGYPDAFLWVGNGLLLGVPVPLLFFLGFTILFSIILRRTKTGVELYLMGTNPTAAWFSGIDNKALLLKTYVVSGCLSGFAGLIVISRTNSAKADYGASYLLQAVLVAILAGVNPRGGYGNVWGLVLAVLSLQFLSIGLNVRMFDDGYRLYGNKFTKEFTWGALLLLVMAINHYVRAYAEKSSGEPS